MYKEWFHAGILLAGLGCACGTLPSAEKRLAAEVTVEAGMCAEHGVLEVVCPKCNPALSAVFKAKGDWCEEHGFPESFCPICHPDRGGRPQAEIRGGDDGAPADGTKIRFKTLETAQLAGLVTVKAVEAPRQNTLESVARLSYDATHMALVSAPVAGIVVKLHVEVGTEVKRGTALATLQSASVAADRSRLVAAQTARATAEARLRRQRELLAVGMIAVREFEAAEQEVAAMQAEFLALQGQVEMVGNGGYSLWILKSPIAGEITRRDTTIGSGVSEGGPLFEVVDASSLWAELDVFEVDLPQVLKGSDVELQFDAFGERSFHGTVAYIAPMIDPKTRTALVRVLLDNADRSLRANMYGNAQITVASAPLAVTLPAIAVQKIKGIDMVFVRLTEDSFESRRVKVRAIIGNEVQLSSGVQPGEDVVTTGSFLLKTETLKDSIGAGCCDKD